MLNKNNFAIAKLADKELSRYSTTNNLLVEQDQTVVTDGHLLLIMSGDSIPQSSYPSVEGFSQTPDHTPISLSRETALAVAKAIPKTKIPAFNHAVVGTNGDGAPAIVTTDTYASQVFKVIDSGRSFPGYEQVLPKKSEAKVVIGFDPRLMVALLQSMDSVYDNGGQHSVVMWVGDETSPILLECKANEQKAVGILMPVKLESATMAIE